MSEEPTPEELDMTTYQPSERVTAQITKAFSYHPPKGSDQLARYNDLRSRARHLASAIVTQTPESREQSLALTKLEEVVMWANAAIARNE